MSHSPQVQSFGDWAVVAIARHYQKMLKHEEKVLRDEDPEELHQMRVGMRRLRTAIAGFSGAIVMPVREKTVGAMARTLGNLRDLDVQQEALNQYHQSDLPAEEQKQLTKVLTVLHRQRQKSFKKTHQLLKSDTYQALKQSFEAWLQSPQLTAIAALPIQTVLPDLLLPALSQFFLHPAWLVNTECNAQGSLILIENLDPHHVEMILETQETILHDLRKMAKRTRYQMELFTNFYSNDYQQVLKPIKEIQEVLGDINDSIVQRAWLDRICGGKARLLLPVLIQKIQGDRLQKWKSWQSLQSHFLDPDQRVRSRLILQQSLLSSSEVLKELN